ncbi:MAG: hypothetical protein IPK44_01770 [Candidatus Accumulibacter sp.]|uniref:hypothetical protein n=1 Tax=Accumulibacter sp. TaxID=2053492 RepID=UPI002583760C|nr:hypothetical protein [Accumulibacter sp.]MBK8113328.1 hypothetical protein [Accumulibacter sp.]
MALPAGGEPAKTEASPAAGSSPAAQGTAAFDPNAFLTQIQAVLDERDRRLQSSLDKRDGHIRKMLAERQGQVNAIGEKAKTLGMQDQQVQALQSALMNDALAEAMKEETPTQPSPAEAGEGAAEVAQAEARAEAMAELAGLTQDDPEVQLITGYATPAEYLAKVKEACAAKMRRTLGVTTPTLTSPVVPTGEGLKVSPTGRGSSVGAAAVMGPGASAADVLPPLARVEAGTLWRRALAEEAERRSR